MRYREMKCVVFYEMWQFQCCGHGFAVGDDVEWVVRKKETFRPAAVVSHEKCDETVDFENEDKYFLKGLDYCCDFHNSEWKELSILKGKVAGIKLLYNKYAATWDSPTYRVPVSDKIVNAKYSWGIDERVGNMRCSGYIVTIEDYMVRPAKEEEITFRL